jgi:hypothetical protein
LGKLYYHSGILATHEKDGQESFVEKGPGWGILHNTIAKNPEEMHKGFQPYDDSFKPSSKLRLGDLIKAGDQKTYDHLKTNCNHAVQDIKEKVRGTDNQNKNNKTP